MKPADRPRGLHGRFLSAEVDTEEILRLRMQEKLTWMKIGEKVGLHYSSCIHRVKKQEPETFKTIRVQPTLIQRFANYAEAYKMFVTEGRKQKVIAVMLRISVNCVRKRIRIMRRLICLKEINQ